jgi:hypothetical protein
MVSIPINKRIADAVLKKSILFRSEKLKDKISALTMINMEQLNLIFALERKNVFNHSMPKIQPQRATTPIASAVPAKILPAVSNCFWNNEITW